MTSSASDAVRVISNKRLPSLVRRRFRRAMYLATVSLPDIDAELEQGTVGPGRLGTTAEALCGSTNPSSVHATSRNGVRRPRGRDDSVCRNTHTRRHNMVAPVVALTVRGGAQYRLSVVRDFETGDILI
jgi:hypothetical protein